MGGNEILNMVSLDKIKKYYYLDGKGKMYMVVPNTSAVSSEATCSFHSFFFDEKLGLYFI